MRWGSLAGAARRAPTQLDRPSASTRSLSTCGHLPTNVVTVIALEGRKQDTVGVIARDPFEVMPELLSPEVTHEVTPVAAPRAGSLPDMSGFGLSLPGAALGLSVRLVGLGLPLPVVGQPHPRLARCTQHWQPCKPRERSGVPRCVAQRTANDRARSASAWICCVAAAQGSASAWFRLPRAERGTRLAQISTKSVKQGTRLAQICFSQAEQGTRLAQICTRSAARGTRLAQICT